MVALGDAARSDPCPEPPAAERWGSISTVLRSRLTRHRRLFGSPQLQQVVNCAQQPPLTPHRSQTTQRKLAEPQHLLQLAEDRLDDPFAFRIHGAAFLRPQL